MTTQKKEKYISWKWDDWNFTEKSSKNNKQSMKKNVALHFARSIYIYENQNTNLLSQFKK